MKSKIVSTALVILFIVAFQSKETPYFEGSIIYVISTISENDSKTGKDFLKEEVHIKSSFYKFKITGGSVSETNFGEVIANTKDSSRYSVNHFTQTKQELGMEQNAEEYRLKSLKLIHAKDSVLGYRCKKYEIYRRDYLTGADLVEYVWVAEDLKISNPSLLAKIFGYQNTLLKDGSLPGIIMKSETINLDSSITTIQVTEVRPMDLEDKIFSVPTTYAIIN